jgi:hypothetical protein
MEMAKGVLGCRFGMTPLIVRTCAVDVFAFLNRTLLRVLEGL